MSAQLGPKTGKMVLARESQHSGKTKIPEIPSFRCMKFVHEAKPNPPLLRRSPSPREGFGEG